MPDYRIGAILLPALLLLFLPMLAAYPWHLPLGNELALPLLTMLVVLFCGLRYPTLLPSPLVFASGLACDLLTRSPMGYWTLVLLLALAASRTAHGLSKRLGRFVILLSWLVLPVFMGMIVHGLASLYQLAKQPVQTTIDGMIMALILFMGPLMLLTGLERVLILKNTGLHSRFFGHHGH